MEKFIYLFIVGCGKSVVVDDFHIDQKRKNLISNKYESSLATWQRLKADHNGNYDFIPFA